MYYNRYGMIKVIFVDWYDTLSESKFWDHLKENDNQTLDKINKALFGEKDIINPWMRGIWTSEEVVRLISKNMRLDYKKIFAEFVVSCQKMKFVSNKIPQLTNQLRMKGYKVIIATDNMDSFTRWTIPAMGIHDIFDGVLNSFDIKALKRDPGEDGKSLFFKDFLKKYNLKGGESILFDDGEDKNGVIGSLGIEYRKISESNSLVSELEKLLK